jgi:hypothetical protein
MFKRTDTDRAHPDSIGMTGSIAAQHFSALKRKAKLTQEPCAW